MTLVRVYCGLASAEAATAPPDSAAWMTVAVVDDSGRLLDICEVTDDAGGYAELISLLTLRSGGQYAAAVATDSDDHTVTQLLGASGRYLAFTDEDSADDYAERFGDDTSPAEIEGNPTERRAIGLARALQAGVLSAVPHSTPRDMLGIKPVLAAHAAIVCGRQAAAATLREVLREVYPAALRAYPDPAEPTPLAILTALPEPGLLGGNASGRNRDAQVVTELANAGVADAATLTDAVTALRVAIAETPRRAGVTRAMTAAIADTIRHSVAAVRSCDEAADALVGVLAEKMSGRSSTTTRASSARGRSTLAPVQSRPGRAGSAASAATTSAATTSSATTSPAATSAATTAPAGTASSRTSSPTRSGTTPAAASIATPAASAAEPVTQPQPAEPARGRRRRAQPAPAAETGTPAKPAGSAQPAPPVSGPPAPTAPTPVSSSPAPISASPAYPTAPTVTRYPMPPASGYPTPPGQGYPASGNGYPAAPAASAYPTNAPASGHPSSPAGSGYPASPVGYPAPAGGGAGYPAPAGDGAGYPAPAGGGATPPPLSLPYPGQQTDRTNGYGDRNGYGDANGYGYGDRNGAGQANGHQSPAPYPQPTLNPGTAAPGSRERWPLVGEAAEPGQPARIGDPARSTDLPRQREGRVTPPWQADDLPVEPPSLRLVEQAPGQEPVRGPEPPRMEPPRGYGEDFTNEPRYEPPALRLVDGDAAHDRGFSRGADRTPDRIYPPGLDRAGDLRGNQPTEPRPARLSGWQAKQPESPIADEADGDLLIFAATRSAWFTDHTDEPAQPDELSWTTAADSGWQAAQQAAEPAVGAETSSGLPRRVPQENLVPGSPIAAPERPLRIVRDAAAIAAHTTGYFQGWRRGQEVGGYSVGGRPGRESARGWDFSRDNDRDYPDREYEYRSARR